MLGSLFGGSKKSSAELTEEGRWAYHDGNYSGAITLFRKALQVDPQNHDCMVHLANTYADLNQHENAVRYYQKAVSLCKSIPEYFPNLCSWIPILLSRFRTLDVPLSL